MSRKAAEIKLVMHYPKMPDGWRLLIGRRILFARLVNAQQKGERLNLNYELSRITAEEAMAAYCTELDIYRQRHPSKSAGREK